MKLILYYMGCGYLSDCWYLGNIAQVLLYTPSDQYCISYYIKNIDCNLNNLIKQG